jgi:hypothetical protein
LTASGATVFNEDEAAEEELVKGDASVAAGKFADAKRSTAMTMHGTMRARP